MVWILPEVALKYFVSVIWQNIIIAHFKASEIVNMLCIHDNVLSWPQNLKLSTFLPNIYSFDSVVKSYWLFGKPCSFAMKLLLSGLRFVLKFACWHHIINVIPGWDSLCCAWKPVICRIYTSWNWSKLKP